MLVHSKLCLTSEKKTIKNLQLVKLLKESSWIGVIQKELGFKQQLDKIYLRNLLLDVVSIMDDHIIVWLIG